MTRGGSRHAEPGPEGDHRGRRRSDASTEGALRTRAHRRDRRWGRGCDGRAGTSEPTEETTSSDVTACGMDDRDMHQTCIKRSAARTLLTGKDVILKGTRVYYSSYKVRKYFVLCNTEGTSRKWPRGNEFHRGSRVAPNICNSKTERGSIRIACKRFIEYNKCVAKVG